MALLVLLLVVVAVVVGVIAEDESFVYDGRTQHGLRWFGGGDVGSVSVCD